MTDESLYPPRCCRQPFPYDDMRHFLNSELREAFDAKREEMDAAKNNNGTYCHVPACSSFIGDANKEGTVGTCSVCDERTCILCKQKAHDGDCPEDEDMQKTEELAQQQGWQRCPNCRRLVELNIGCNHMTCRCNTSFCYACGRIWKTCTCPQFEERNLLARANEIGRREGRRDVAAVAEGLRQNHDCQGNHNWMFTRGGNRCDECTDFLQTFIFRCSWCRMQVCRRCRDNRL